MQQKTEIDQENRLKLNLREQRNWSVQIEELVAPESLLGSQYFNQMTRDEEL